MDGDVRQNLAVEVRARGLEAGDQTAVGQPVQTSGGVDAHDPQTAELALLLPPVAVGVVESFVDRLFGDPVGLGFGAVEAAGQRENLLPPLGALITTLDACHRPTSFLLPERKRSGPHSLVRSRSIESDGGRDPRRTGLFPPRSSGF